MAIELQVFEFRGHAVRRGGTPDNPWFVAKDVCDVLGLSNVSMALDRLRADEKGISSADTPGGKQEMLTVYESGLYRLIFQSRRAEAEAFRTWVFHDVLPAIRKTGTYSVPGSEPIEVVQRFADTADRILSRGGMEARDELLLKDFVRSRLALESAGAAATTCWVTISERCVALGYPRPRRGEDQKIGKAVAAAYRRERGEEPPKHQQFVDGRVVPVCTYTGADLDVVDAAIHAYHRAVRADGIDHRPPSRNLDLNLDDSTN